MNGGTKEIKDLLEIERQLRIQEKEFYIAAVTNVNLRTRDLMKNDLGITFVKNSAWDIADRVVDNYFNTSECYISAQHMYERIVNFSYDDENDILINNASMREMLYKSDNTVEVLNDIEIKCRESQEKLFLKEKKRSKNGKEYSEYIDKDEYIKPGKENYRKERGQNSEKLFDELTGINEDELQHSLEVDHVQAAATATYNSRYVNGAEAIDELKKFYNSSDNFQMLNKSANGSKGDVRVFSDGEKSISEVKMLQEKKEIVKKYKEDNVRKGLSAKEAEKQAKERATQEFDNKYVDITYKATAEELAQAVCDRWENANPNAIENLKNTGVLDENGKVVTNVRENLENNLKTSMNKESLVVLKNLDYLEVAKDSLKPIRGAIKKIVAGQVVYYVLPPLVYETQCIIRKKNMTLDTFLKQLPKIGKRVYKYVASKMGEILQNIVGNCLNSFLKVFFDLIIEMVKETVKRMLKIVKKLVMSLVNCLNILVSPRSNTREKADAITKIMSTTVTTILIEILFEWAEKQFNLPNFLMEPLQIIVTVLATNLIMLILQKADLFDTQYGLLVSNIQMVFEDEYMQYVDKSSLLMKEAQLKVEEKVKLLTTNIENIHNSMKEINLYRDNVENDLNKINDIFDMGIDFNEEWNQFITI